VHHRSTEHILVILPVYKCPDEIPDKCHYDKHHYEKHNIGG